MCQLEGCDRGGRDSAAELALAGGIECNVGRLLQPADFEASPTRRRKSYSREVMRQRLCSRSGDTLHKVRRNRRGPFVYWSFDTLQTASYTANSSIANGQVAQLVERGPEKAGVGGSIPSLATILFNNLRLVENLLYRFLASTQPDS
jgi:hypothetical protein